MTKLKTLVLFLPIYFLPITTTIAQEDELRSGDVWTRMKDESATLFSNTVMITSELLGKINDTIENEFQEIRDAQQNNSDVDLKDKIDSIRIYVNRVSKLKQSERDASNFSLISKSKKDYRLDLDEVLNEIEPILFDGEVVNYSSRIRNARSQIAELKEDKVSLNEKLNFAPEKGNVFSSSKDNILDEIEQINELITKSEKLIDQLEFDLKRKLASLGINLTRKQIRVMTTRVDGDELARSFAIFDITRQISNVLAKMMQDNAFSANASVKYYGTYVILSEILGYSQREYIRKLETIYLPSLNKIETEIKSAIEYAEEGYANATLDSSKKIFKSNIESNKFSLRVLVSYKEILNGQIRKITDALHSTNEQITVAYSTFDTAANSANLINLINDTQASFDQIMSMQVPDIVPFENSELELKFQEISNKVLNATEN